MSGAGGSKPLQSLRIIRDEKAYKEQYARYPITLQAAERNRTAYVDKIFESWNKLNTVLLHYEGTLRKRWMKKTIAQRKKILLEAWPDMPAAHRADLQQVLYPPARGRRANSSTSDAIFKWPHINLEDLSPAHSLLLLLNARGRNLPHVFAHGDVAACTFGLDNKHIMIADLNGYAMVFVGQDARETYGKLLHLTTNFETVRLWACGIHFEVGKGILLLEIQCKLLQFLVDCCYFIFHDIPRESLVNPGIPPQPEPLAITLKESSYLQLSSIVAEAPYRVPASLNTCRLLLLLEARRFAAEDHLWDLREDPGYFGSLLLDLSERRFEMVPDKDGKIFKYPDRDRFWNNLIAEVVDNGHTFLIMWTKLVELARLLDFKASDGKLTFDPQKELPKDVEDIIIRMLVHLHHQAGGLLKDLNYGFTASSRELGLKIIRHTAMSEEGKPFHKVFPHGGMRANDPLMVLLLRILESSRDGLKQYGLANLMDELQRHLDQHPNEKMRLSSGATETFSDLALNVTIMRELMSLFPWASGFERKMGNFELPGDVDEGVEDSWTVRETIDKDNDHYGGAEATRLPLPVTRKSWYYPIEKPRNAANVEALRAAESRLDSFWGSIDDFFMRSNGESLYGILCRYTVKERKVQRTHPWVEPEKPARPPSIEEDVRVDFSKLDLTPEKPSRPAVEVQRVKVKTRGTRSELTDDRDELQRPQPEVSAQSFPSGCKLSKIATKVFQTLFHTHDSDGHAGEIAWTDFKHAMAAIGFAAEKLYGSVWHFTPEKFEAERSIHVHEPHPTGKIPFYRARRLGRRLTRTYGWEGDMFVTKD